MSDSVGWAWIEELRLIEKNLLCCRECIHRLCDAITRRTPKTRNVDKEILQCINAQPCMELAGSSVSLQISSRCLEIKSLETNETIARHDMPRVSFASGGDAVCEFDDSAWQSVALNLIVLGDTRLCRLCSEGCHRMASLLCNRMRQW